MKKKLILICIVISMLFVCAGCGIEQPTVLTINGDEVSLLEYNYYFSNLKLQAEQTVPAEQIEMYWETEKDGKTAFELLKKSAYDEMVALRVAANKAEAMGISYTDSNVVQSITDFKNQIVQMAPSENEYYEMTNTDSKTIYEIAKLYAIRSAMLSKLIADGTINLTEEAFKSTFEEKMMKAQHILISTVDSNTGVALSDQEKTAKKAQAEEILKRVKAGENFTALMNEFSEDPGKESLPDGYVFATGEMVVEFEDAVKALEPGQISEIVESSFGYHIIKRLPLSVETDASSFEQYKDYIQTEILLSYIAENVPLWKEEMTIIENKAPIDKIKL